MDILINRTDAADIGNSKSHKNRFSLDEILMCDIDFYKTEIGPEKASQFLCVNEKFSIVFFF